MLILLSCAKTMGGIPSIQTPFTTQPLFQKEANLIARQMQAYSAGELSHILKVNPRIAGENQIRFKHFSIPGITGREALLSYTGIVFKKLNPAGFSAEDFKYAQDHLRITSFCYGLLRPLDLIRPYRLEGAVTLPGLGNQSLFDYWKEKLTDRLIKDTKAAGGILCNLASGEMKRLFDWNRVEKELQVISPEFPTWKNGRPVTIVIYTKMARGETARFILKNKIETISRLHKEFLNPFGQ